MSVDSWQPVPQPQDIGAEQLEKLIKLANSDQDLTPDLEWIQPFAQMEKSKWTAIANELSAEAIVSLIKLFTLSEANGNWDLGEKSAVIPLFKVLRKQTGIDKALVQWVKEHTDNKYLPFGPLI